MPLRRSAASAAGSRMLWLLAGTVLSMSCWAPNTLGMLYPSGSIICQMAPVGPQLRRTPAVAQRRVEGAEPAAAQRLAQVLDPQRVEAELVRTAGRWLVDSYGSAP